MRWLLGAYGVSAFGTRLAFDAFPLVAILVLHAGPAQVSALAAAGLAAAAVLALPLGPWVDFRRKRPVMIAMDLVRCAAVGSVPVAFALGLLTFAHLLVVSVVVATADVAFTAASGAFLKGLAPPGELLRANGRLESITWTTTLVGPPLGGVAVGLFGPVTTIVADAASYLLSALGLRAIRGEEPPPPVRDRRLRARDLAAGWRHLLTHPALRALFLNTLLVNALIMVSAPIMATLMLGELGFTPFAYGLAFGAPCLGGLLGARMAPKLVARFGRDRVLRVSGIARVVWPVGLAFVVPGVPGLVLVMVLQFCLVACIGVFNPISVTYRLEQTETPLLARMLAAWSVTGKATTATMTALWGLLATAAGPRTAVAAAGILLLTTPLLLPRRSALRSGPRRGAPLEAAAPPPTP